MLPGSEPRSNEDLDWHYNLRFKQTSIFGDIQPWNLTKSWIEQCNPSQSWIEDTVGVSNWETQSVPQSNWVNINDPNINKQRC